MFCDKCGRELKGTDKFCGGCGAPVQEAIGADPLQAVTFSGPEGTQEKPKKVKTGKPIKVLLAVLSVIVVAVAGSAIYLNSAGYICKRAVKLAEAGKYEEAIRSLEERMREITSANKKAKFYRAKSDVYLSAGDCLWALQTLADGIADTGDTALSDREEYVREHTLVAKWTIDGIGEEFLVFSKEYEYDGVGNRTKETYYDEAGSILSWIEYEYDGSGKPIKMTRYDEAGSILEWSEYEYDGWGNRTKETYYDEDGSLEGYWIEYEYDGGNRTMVTYYYGEGSILYRIKYEYDVVGNSTKETCYYGLVAIILFPYGYDVVGNPTKETHYDGDGNIVGRLEREYDVMGNPTKITGYDEDGRIAGWGEYESDRMGNLTKEIYYDEEGSIEDWIELKYEYIFVGE